MSTPDNPDSGQLTRRQMRQARNTGATPIIRADTAVATQEPPAPKAPLPRAARPVPVAPAPGPDASVDLGVSPLTRRQARQQERIRTASVPVITPEIAASHGGRAFAPSAVVPEAEPVVWTPAVADERDQVVEADVEAPAAEADAVEEVVEAPAVEEAAPEARAAEEIVAEADAEAPVADAPSAWAPVTAEVVAEPEAAAPEQVEAALVDEVPTSVADEPEADEPWLDPSDAGAEAETAVPQVDARLGENVLATAEPADVSAVSFDDLITRDSGSGSSGATPHALILTHVPEASPLSAVTSTGEVIVTGIYNLPDGLGSQGHAHGAADGKEIDASLIDGELPASSSPTPIAASAAISTVRGTGEIIRPPAPEKSNRWVMGLMITAGALALALVGLLVYVVATGVFN